jgi:poly-gamma-glutamate capsule biosynthesis protein CapA/YwtB (metallophosphatase superfamily)
MYESASGDITLAFTGDAMISRALMPFREPRFLKLRDLLHGVDTSITNGEMLFHNYEDSPTFYSQTYMRCDPRYIKDLQWMGIDMMGCANNHGTDFGENGVLTNIRSLDAAGMVHAGSGKNLGEAIAPAYMDTPRGRVALISATSSARPNSRAGEQRPDMLGRPGVNLIRWINEWTVDEEAFLALERIASKFGWRQTVPGWLVNSYGLNREDAIAKAVYMLDRNLLGVGSEDPAGRFVLGDGFERHSRIHVPDMEANLHSIRAARRMADWVIFSMHSHEGGSSEDEPAEHISELAHAVIDAGADVFIGHGPHIDRGVEVYNGKPVIYSLGQFIVQNDTVERMPQDSMVLYGLGHENVAADLFDARRSGPRREYPDGDPHAQSAVATVRLDRGGLRELTLYPIEFGSELPRSQSGRPLLAEGKNAGQALERIRRLSEPFGTKLELEGETGVVRRP